jgi:hypothetical protein
MAKGKQLEMLDIYKIMLCYYTTRNYSEVERRLGIPRKTVEKIYNEHKNDEEFQKLCQQKKDEFVEKANRIIDKTMNRIEKELDSDTKIPLNQLATTLGITIDKKALVETEINTTETPSVQINIVDNSNLESTLYEEEE